MTTTQYRWIVFCQIAVMCVLGLTSVAVILSAVPRLRSRQNLEGAIEHYAQGTESGIRSAQQALDKVFARHPDMPEALALRGRIGVERGLLSIAYDSYARLETALAARGRSTAPALNGTGCAMLLKARRSAEPDRKLLQEGYETFRAAIEQDPMNGDPHVNTAICLLHLGQYGKAAESLAQARRTMDFTYESLVAYHSALGSMLSATATSNSQTVTLVAGKFDDVDYRLRKAVGMLFRAAEELDKASGLAQDRPIARGLKVNAALAKAKLLAWAPLGASQAADCRSAVINAVVREKETLGARQVQLLRVILAVSFDRIGQGRDSLRWAREAAAAAEISPEVTFYIGSAFYQIAQSQSDAATRNRYETDALKRLLSVLESKSLHSWLRFAAHAQVAVCLWHSSDRSGALRELDEAAALMGKLEAAGRAPKRSRAGFYRNYAIVLYHAGRVGDAVAALQKSLSADGKQGAVRRLLAQIRKEPVVSDVQIVAAQQVPPNMPVIRARVSSGGPVAVTRDDITVLVDGARVKSFLVGPESRIYFLPEGPLAQGAHAIQVVVRRGGKVLTTSEHRIEVKYPRP